MDFYFLKRKSAASPQTSPEKSVTCVAAKEDRNQTIMSSTVLKTGVEEPWAIETTA